MIANIPKVRHTMETKLLKQALEGDHRAANRALKYLSSANHTLRRIMQESIYDLAELRLWEQLLNCLALQRWNDHLDCERRDDPIASEIIDQSIIEVFIEDVSEEDRCMKEEVLLNGLSDSNPQRRKMAAYVLGLRGDPRAIPILSDTIESGTKEWKLQLIKALESIKDERSGLLLLRILCLERDVAHREAGRALNRMGSLVESTWLEALNYPDNHIRWHGARGLGNIGNAKYAFTLAEGLLAEKQVVRWATADALAKLGENGLPATLTIISQYELTEQSRRAAYHALHGIVSRRVQLRIEPLLEALRGPAASLEAPAIAQRLLKQWELDNHG